MAKAVRSAAFRHLILAAGLSCFLSAAFGEEFYEQQLRIGKADLASGRTVQASDELRIAAFGLLERPPMLSDALVSLAIAQNTLAQKAAVTQTINRFLDLERRFSVYESAPIDPQSRAQFESLLLKNALRSDLAAIPGLARLFRSDADRVSDLPVERRAAAYEEGSRRSPKDVAWPLAAARDAAAQGLDQDAVRWSRRALSIDNKNSIARAILGHALARRGECREALTQIASLPPGEFTTHSELKGDQFVCLVRESRWNDADAAFAKLPQTERARTDVLRASDTLAMHRNPSAPRTIIPSAPAATIPAVTTTSQRPPATATAVGPSTAARSPEILPSAKALVASGKYADAVRILGPAVAADPANRGLHLAMLEAASLAGDWRTAVAQVVPSSPFLSGEEASMFYASTALYENGKTDEARRLMLKARPRLQSTPFVDYYSNIILGRSTNR
jgi:tetratricopeptide (TPR) repeat protein